MFNSPQRWLVPCSLVLITGCMQPSMGPGYMYGPQYQYPQPGFAPMNNFGAPGTLVVPPSNAPLYDPGQSSSGGTYENDPKDTWTTPSNPTGSDGGMFDDGGLVPAPRDPQSGGSNSPFYEDNFNSGGNSGVQIFPSNNFEVTRGNSVASQHDDSAALTVARPVSYGYDVNGYRWLQGVLRQHPESKRWSLVYNLSGDDTFHGDMMLNIDPVKLDGLNSGSVVQVRGQVNSEQLDARGRATYQVDQIYEVPAGA